MQQDDGGAVRRAGLGIAHAEQAGIHLLDRREARPRPAPAQSAPVPRSRAPNSRGAMVAAAAPRSRRRPWSIGFGLHGLLPSLRLSMRDTMRATGDGAALTDLQETFRRHDFVRHPADAGAAMPGAVAT